MSMGRESRLISGSTNPSSSNLAPGSLKLLAFFFHPFLQCGLFVNSETRGVISHILRDFHRAELWAAHAAEVRELGSILRERFVMEVFSGSRIQTEIELVVPAEFEPGLA